MTRIDEVLRRPELVDRPPVLVDIGASGQLPKEWGPLASQSICIAFDADDRDFGAHVTRTHPYKTLHLHNNIVSDTEHAELEFYLTRSPHCSSSLEPDSDSLSAWVFADLFDVERRVRLRARSLSEILREHGLSYVDWFKTDSQGTDLRLFLSLDTTIVEKVLAASFEPGIIDAYRGEDKLHSLLLKMEGLPFWLQDLDVRGTQRLSRKLWEERVRPRAGGWLPLGLRTSPGWVEASYLNTMEPLKRFDRRDLLLAWVFATIHAQHGFALELAVKAEQEFGDQIFTVLADDSLSATVRVADRVVANIAKRAIAATRALTTRLLRRT